MAIDTTAVASFFTDGFTNISTVDPSAGYTKMSLSLYTQDGKLFPCSVEYEAAPGDTITPANVADIATKVYNSVKSNANGFAIKNVKDGLDLPSGARFYQSYYNVGLNVYGVVATLTK